MKYLVNRKEMQQLELNTIESIGIPSAVLMERAAISVVDEILQSPYGTCILVLCGAGNNGGDGFAVARLLHLRGYNVTVLAPFDSSHFTKDSLLQYEILKKYNVPIIREFPEEQSFDVIVDGLFGTGLSRDITGDTAELIHRCNHDQAIKIAIDLPSGISADTGEVLGAAFHADKMVTFAFEKLGQYLFPGSQFCGAVVCRDIGIYVDINSCVFPGIRAFELSDLPEHMPKHRPDADKGSIGKLLIIAGSKNIAGAAILAAKAAYATGCGYVKIVSSEENRIILQTSVPQAVLESYESIDDITHILSKSLEWADAIVIGPGIGQGPTATQLVKQVLSNCLVPVVADADALNIMAKDMSILNTLPCEMIITPHPGELGRLLNSSAESVKRNLFQSAEKLVKEYSVTCIAKDARTAICAKSGNQYLNLSGNAGMATAGSGDVLAGCIGSLIAQKSDIETASVLGAFLHGHAGDIMKQVSNPYSMTALDLIQGIRLAINKIYKTEQVFQEES
ncbi:MAG: NAD(P)H-hydrate dehydratase [Lachnospiraceae bacterium]